MKDEHSSRSGGLLPRFLQLFLLLASLVILDIAVFALVPTDILMPGEQNTPHPSDAVAVLFNDYNDQYDGVNRETERRINYGLHLFEQGLARAFVVVGGGRNHRRTAGALLMASFARRKGVPEEHVFIDRTSYDTRTNLEGIRELMDINGWETVLLVSSPHHVARIRRVFGERLSQGIIPAPYPAATCDPPLRRTEIWLSAHCNALAGGMSTLLPPAWYETAVIWVRENTDL